MSRLIDGDELLKWMNETQWHTSKMDAVRAKIKSMPTVERKGEWKDRTYGGRILHPWWESCECSQCEEWGSGAWNFCPNCGARMKGADDE